MTTALEVRQARPEDLETLVDFNAALAWESEGRRLDKARLARGVASILSDTGKGTYWVATAGGTVVGALLITREYSDWRDGWFWWIQSVYVRESWRRRGVFSALYRDVAQKARTTPGVCGLRLYVEQHNEKAQATYRAVGMKQTSYRLYELDFTGPA